MAKTNNKLATNIGNLRPKENLVAAQSIPQYDTVNKQGLPAYTQDKWSKLLTILNTSKLQPQYYRDETETLVDLAESIAECAIEDLYFTCQCIVYSRNVGAGMRSITQAAAILIAPYLSGAEFSKRFYGSFNKKTQTGGVIGRPDDMLNILEGFIALNGEGPKLTNAMKKGFKSAIESYDSYSLLKYKSSLIDVINLVRPVSRGSKATVKVMIDNVEKEMFTLDAIMQGMSVSANTWEVNQSEAGQIVAKAIIEGKVDAEEAKVILEEAKADNWDEMLTDGSLGILAAIRNVRNILKVTTKPDTIAKLCKLLSNGDVIRKAKVMPYQLDIANEVLMTEFNSLPARDVSAALLTGYSSAIPNLTALLPGRNVIFLDKSRSMGTDIRVFNGKEYVHSRTNCMNKASLIAATIAIATKADIVGFGSTAKYIQYNPNVDVFTLANQLNSADMGMTSIASAWKLVSDSKVLYNRVFILSDNEANLGSTYDAYKTYMQKVGNPYVYSVDLAGYKTNSIAGPNVRYYFGYSFSMFDDIATSEFNANHHIDKVKLITI